MCNSTALVKDVIIDCKILWGQFYSCVSRCFSIETHVSNQNHWLSFIGYQGKAVTIGSHHNSWLCRIITSSESIGPYTLTTSYAVRWKYHTKSSSSDCFPTRLDQYVCVSDTLLYLQSLSDKSMKNRLHIPLPSPFFLWSNQSRSRQIYHPSDEARATFPLHSRIPLLVFASPDIC